MQRFTALIGDKHATT